MSIAVEVRRNTYQDSVTLMRLSSDLLAEDGVTNASIMMGTAGNIEIMREGGLDAPALNDARPTDLVIAIVAGLFVTWRDVLGSIGSWLFAGTALVLVSGFAAGWLVGLGRGTSERTVLGLATAQRNVSAALVVAASLGPDAMVRTLVAALFIPLALIVVAGEVGRRSDSSATSDQPAEGTTA